MTEPGSSTDAINRLSAALADRYRIEREIGAGGMATVYLARDLKHDRKVAVKVLKPELAAVLGAERFLSEIKVTANLQHPHILPLHDSGEADGFLLYVMPFVEGESLRAKLDREKQLSVDEAVGIAKSVASALDYAHRHGVIHRDIKPANILLHDGQPMVADFGIALAVRAAGGERLTETGLSLGTPQYMSPEQASGDREVDGRSDLYSLGAVLYEMLTGEPPHSGPTVQAVIAKLLADKPRPVTELRETVPDHVAATVHKALAKLPADRFGGAGEMAEAVDDPGFRVSLSTEPSAAAGEPRKTKVVAVALALIGLAAGIAMGLSFSPSPRRPVTRFSVLLSGEQGIEPAQGVNLAIAPDGSWLVFRGQSQLWRRSMEGLDIEPIPGTEGARNPVISPDGRSVAFSAYNSLEIVSLEGGPPETVVDSGVPGGLGGISWGDENTLYFTSSKGAIHRLSLPERQDDTLTSNVAGTYHSWLDALPDGRGVIFTMVNGTVPARSEVAVLSLPDGEVRTLVRGTMGRYMDSGHLVYSAADGTLMAIELDPRRLVAIGPSVGMNDRARVYTGSATQFALSDGGTLVLQPPERPLELVPVWVTRDGEVTDVDPGFRIRTRTGSVSMALSPDGAVLAYAQEEEDGPRNVWIRNLADGSQYPLTSEGSRNTVVGWSRDGRSVYFASNRAGQLEDIWERPRDLSSGAQLVLDRELEVFELISSMDGQWIGFREGARTVGDLFASPAGGRSIPVPLEATEHDERSMALSPNDRWLAYVSNEPGRDEVFLRRFPDQRSPHWPVSTGGGTEPLWAHTGNELFYRNGDGALVSVQVSGDSIPQFGPRSVLFSATGYLASPDPVYSVDSGNERFLMLRPIESDEVVQLNVVLNFQEEVRRRLAGGR